MVIWLTSNDVAHSTDGGDVDVLVGVLQQLHQSWYKAVVDDGLDLVVIAIGQV